MLALASGSYDFDAYPLLDQVSIHGACVTATDLIHVHLGDRSELHDVRLSEGLRVDGSEVSLDGVEAFATISALGDVIASDLAVRGSTIGVDVTGSLSLDRFHAEGVHGYALHVTGPLILTDAVVDGVSGSSPNTGAITVFGPAELHGVLVEDVERCAVLASTQPGDAGSHLLEDIVIRRVASPPLVPDDPNDATRGALWFWGHGECRRVSIEDSEEPGFIVITSSSTISDVSVLNLHPGANPVTEGILLAGGVSRLSRVEIGETVGPGLIAAGRGTFAVGDLTIAAERDAPRGVYAADQSTIRIARADLGGFVALPLVILDAALEISDAELHDIRGGAAISLTASVAESSLRAERVAIRDIAGVSIAVNSAEFEPSVALEDVTMLRVSSGINAQGGRGAHVTMTHVRMDGGAFPLAIRGGDAAINDSTFDDIAGGILINWDGLDAPALPTRFSAERVELLNLRDAGINIDRSGADIELADVRMTGGGKPFQCGQFFNDSIISVRMTRVGADGGDRSGDAIGLNLQRCTLEATDLSVSRFGDTGLEITNSDALVRRFLFERNEVGIRANQGLVLVDGRLLDNHVALELGQAPRPDQVVGVSFEGNGADVGE